jgi:predicted  nucleic acid-binding Zn-ribbon protein
LIYYNMSDNEAKCVNISNNDNLINMCVDSTGMICTNEDSRLPISGDNWTEIGLYQSATDPNHGGDFGSAIYDDITNGIFTSNTPGEIKLSLLTETDTDRPRFKTPKTLKTALMDLYGSQNDIATQPNCSACMGEGGSRVEGGANAPCRTTGQQWYYDAQAPTSNFPSDVSAYGGCVKLTLQDGDTAPDMSNIRDPLQRGNPDPNFQYFNNAETCVSSYTIGSDLMSNPLEYTNTGAIPTLYDISDRDCKSVDIREEMLSNVVNPSDNCAVIDCNDKRYFVDQNTCIAERGNQETERATAAEITERRQRINSDMALGALLTAESVRAITAERGLRTDITNNQKEIRAVNRRLTNEIRQRKQANKIIRQALIVYVNNVKSELSNNIEQLNASLETINRQLSASLTNIQTQLNSAIGNFNASLQEEQTRAESVEKTLNTSINTHYGELLTKVGRLKKRIKNLNSSLTAMKASDETRFSSIDTRFGSIGADITNLQQSILKEKNRRMRQNVNLMSLMSLTRRRLLNQISDNTSAISANTSAISDNTDTISSNIETINGQVTSINANLIVLGTRLGDLNSRLTDNNTAIQSLQTEQGSESATLDSIHNDESSESDTISSLSNNIKTLSNQYTQLQSGFENNTNDIEDLGNNMQTLTLHAQDIQQSLQSQSLQSQSLQSQIDNLNTQRVNINSTVNMTNTNNNSDPVAPAPATTNADPDPDAPAPPLGEGFAMPGPGIFQHIIYLLIVCLALFLIYMLIFRYKELNKFIVKSFK